MKKLRVRALSMLLSLIMVVSMLPFTAQAASAPENASAQYQYANSILEELNESLPSNEQYTLSGPFPLSGSDLYTYELFRTVQNPESGARVTDSRYVVVPGVDAVNTSMKDYNNVSETPWSAANISGIYIADGVTGIGAHAFENIATLKTLEIQDPSDLVYVGEYAFNGCDKLTGPIDLSGVTELGEYAFNACERLGSVVLSDNLTDIPKNAFNTCGLTSVNIPANVQTIGDGAFANNAMSGNLVLPDTLTTIGDSAFYRYISGGSTGGYTSITIPASVTSIGQNAFSGHKSLETVTLQHTDANRLTIENGAFGTDTYTAHNYVSDVVVDDGNSQITYHDVTMGTQFLTQNEDVANLLVNEVNCYQGNLKPLKYKETSPATCEEDGYHLYTMTLTGVTTDGKDVSMDTKITIPAVGHNYVQRPDLAATCHYPERTLEECTNVENGLVETCEQPQRIAVKPNGQAALGHDYQVTSVDNPTISDDNSGNTVVTYTCSHYSENEADNRHDEYSPTYAWQIEPTTLAASTSHRLSDLTLPAVTGVGSNSITAQLVWDEEDTNALLPAGTHTYKVKLDITGTQSTFPDYTDPDGEFLITVQVEKEKLDFSAVAFQNSTRYTGLNNPDFAVDGMPAGTTITKYEYCKKGEDTWTENKPAEANADTDAAEYRVRVTFTYEDDKYLLDADSPELQPDSAYELEAGPDRKSGTITGDYVVRALTEDDLTVTPKNGLVYNKSQQNTVTVSGIPAGAKVSVTWTENSQTHTETINSASQSSYDVAGITNAGSYEITVRVEHSGFSGGFVEKTVTGTIAKKTVTTPKANTDLQPYTPTQSQTGVPDSTDSTIYTVSNNRQENAGTYIAEAVLEDPANYKWSTGDGNNDGTAEISYTIPRRQLQKPSLVQERYSFTGDPIMPLQRNNNELDGTFDSDGKLTSYWRAYGQSYVAYTATQVQMTDAGNYRITATLNNSNDVKNYSWADGTDASFTLTWEIAKQQIAAPTVTVSGADYTGVAYDAAANIKLTAPSEDSENVLTLGSDHTYYSNSTTSTPMTDTPVNAGTYYVEVDFDYENGLKPDNYQIIGNTRKAFSINKATATLKFDDETQSAAYTADGTSLQLATVDELVAADQLKDPSTLYTISYSYQYKATTEEEFGEAISISDPTNYTFKNVGIYQIMAKLGAGTQSNNYTAADASYTLTIGKSNQTITLTPESGTDWDTGHDTPGTYQITKTLGDAPFTVTGTAALDSGNVTITYEATEEKDTASAEANVVTVENNGTVTLLRAGTATVTVKAAQTANVGEASVSYQLVINKADANLTLTEQSFGYTGSAITDYEKATVTNAGNSAAPVDTSKITYAFFQDDNGGPGNPMGNAPSQVGTYWLKASLTGDPNYEDDTETAKVTITEKDLTVDIAGYTGTYDGDSHDAAAITSVTGTGTISSYKAYFAVTSTDTAPDAPSSEWKDSLQVQDVADSSGSAMYYWYKVEADNHNPAIGSFTVKISPKTLAVSGVPDSFEKEYDGDNTVTTDLRGITVAGVTGETISVRATGTYDSGNAGNGKQVTLTLTLDGVSEWGNYSYKNVPLTEGKLTLTETTGNITPKPITVTGGITATDRVYDGTFSVKLTGTTLTSSGVLDADKDDVQLTLKANAVGTLADADAENGKQVTIATSQIQPDGDKAGNYDVTSVTPVTVNISKAPVTLTAPAETTASYTGEPLDTKYYQVTASGLTNNDGVEFSAANDITYTFQKGSEAATTTVPGDQGEYTVTATLAATAADKYKNYDVRQETFTVTINASVLTETPKDYSEPYDGKDHNLEDLITSVTGVGGADVSRYTVVFVKSDTEPTDWTSAAVTSVKNVADSGTYWYRISADNYTDKTGSVEVGISRLELTVTPTLSTKTKVYDGMTDFQTANITSTDVTGEAAGETITARVASATYNSKGVADADTITIRYTLSGADLANYTYGGTELGNGTDTVSVTKKGTITAKDVTVTVPDQTMTYNGTTTFTAGTDINCTAVTGTVTGESLTAYIGAGETGTAGSKGAGTTTVTFAAGAVTLTAGQNTDARNYRVSGPVTAELTISPRTITLNFTNAQDGTITTSYTGNEVESGVYAATIDGMESGDNSPAATDIIYTFYTNEECTDSFSGTPSGVGTYWVKAVVNENSAVNGNYTSAQAAAKLVITTDAHVSLTVEPNAYSGTYDGKPHNASNGMVVKAGGAPLTDGDYTIYYTETKPDDGNKLDPSAYGSNTTMPSYTDAGSYTVYYLVDAKNYNDVAGSFTVEIERAMLTLTRDVTTAKTYDSTTEAASQVTNVELTGQQNYENISAIRDSAVYNEATVNGAKTITITYTLTTKDGAKLENYTVKIADAGAVDAAASMTETVSASITKAPVEVTIQNQPAVYDGSKPAVEQDKWTVSSGTVYNNDDLGIRLSIPDDAKNVGTYDISGAPSNPNYAVTFVKGRFEVTHRPVTIEIGDAQGVYGDAPDLSGVTLTDATVSAQDQGMVSGDSTDLFRSLLSTNADEKSSVGEYDITGTAGEHGNYDVTFTKGTYTVNQRPVTVTIDDKSSLYGQDIVGLTWSVTGGTMANGEDLGITLETTAVKGSDAGTYAISEKSRNTAVAANYNVTVVGQTFFSGDSTKATYTISKAYLEAAFDSKVLYPNFGRPVTNPVTFSNVSVNPYAEVVGQDDLADIAAAAHYTSDNPSAVSVDEKTGAVTLISANASATISLTVGETQNFNAITVPVTYTINVGSAGGYQPNFTPGNLTYNGQRQQLMTLNGSLPAGLSIQYSTDNTSWKSDLTQITGTDAGNYTVYWKITDSSGNYGDSNGTVFVTIAKDILEDEEGFTHKSPSIVFSQYQNKTYENPLQLPGDYHGTVTFQGSNDTVATIDADGKVTVKQNGTVTITATCYTDDNYQGRQYSYTLTVASSGIDYTAPAALNSTYNGEEQDSLTTPVTSTTPGAVIRYGVNTGGLSFPDEDVPKIKDAGTYEIWYQVTAPGGYATVVGHVTAVIHPKDITEGMISGISDSYTYSGNKITPIPTVTDQELSQRLTANVDYTLSYGENTQVGTTGTVTIAGTGNYGDFIQRTFKIEAVGGEEITASLSEYYGSLDQHPTGTTTQVSVTHGNHDVGFTITGVTPTAQVDADGKTISFTTPGVYTITVKAGDTLHAEQEFTLTYMLMHKTSDGGFILTFDGNDTRVVTYGQRLIPEGQTAAGLLEVKDGNGDVLAYGTDYTLSCMYYDCLGNSGQAVTTVQGIPAAGMYVVTAAGTGQYGSDQTGVFTLLVLQKNIGGEDITWTVADDALVYNAGAQEPAVTSGTFTDEAGGTQSVEFAVDSYQNNTNAGSDTARAIVKVPAGSNNYTGTASIPFSIGRRPITDDAGKFTITVPTSVSISVGGEARPAVTIYDEELGRELTSQDFTVTYANNTSAGTATVSITGTGNYYTGTDIQKTFSVVVTSTTFSMEITPVTKWAYGDTGATDITVSGNSGITLAVGTDYTLFISKDGGAEQSFTNTADALAYLDKPGTYTVKATGTGGYSFTETQTVTIEKAKLSLEILVTPNVKAGNGTAKIQVTPGTWPAGIDGTKFTKLTVTKGGTAQEDLTLEYDGTAGTYKEVTFYFGNDTTVYAFGVDTAEITGFDPDCYELDITGGTLSVVQQTGGGGGGGIGAVTYTITASAGDHGSINPAGKVSVVKGQDAAFVFTADSGWQVADVLVDGVSAGAVSSYTFTNVTANHTISVTFEKDSTIADPDDTGVSDWLITGDHILYLNGYGQDLFGPTDNLTRAQAAQLFYNLLLEKDVPVTVSFTDVPADAWYAEAVHTLASLGIVEGVGGGLFDPERSITRAEFTVIAMRFAQPNVIDTDIFPDVSRNDWFYEQVVSAVQYGWINGYADGTFRPNETITRAEVAAIVNRMLGRSADRTYVDAHANELTQFTDVSPYYWAYYDIMEAANAHDHIKKDGTEIWKD